MSPPDFEPLEKLPPARKRITAVLLAQDWKRETIEDLLADFQHELAEEIREERDSMREEMKKDPDSLVTPTDLDGMSTAANVIDPHPVDPREEPTA